ncbi:MAG: serine/threonine-protein kinase [Planctomycetota bacterium]|nr:serine/threonine-protein kinase [Planctomycetota bacterium]
MSPEDRELIKEVLLELDEAEAADRPAILSRFRLAHPELMASLGDYVPFLDVADEALLGDSESPSPPAVVGRFRIERPLGRGAMGEVYLAQEPPPMGRQVALKLIRHGLASKQIRRRFEFERETLKSLDHENVARIIDGGTSDDGTPYVAMEYVDGRPITVYATVSALRLEDQVDLIRQICSGVAHAHLKGLVHRDLKPANVLVAKRDGRAVAKIIDFGIAKLLGMAASPDGTVPGTPVGTIEYMSPEQAQGLMAVVDQRSDIYSIGVILYQLLTGSLPRAREELLGWAGPDFLRRMSHARVSPPSHALAARGAGSATPSRLRLRELDWITLKALEVDPARRYRSAQEFADDLDRFLRGEPVRAAPQTLKYRLRKWIARRPAAAGLGAASVLALAAMGAAVVSSQRQTAHALVSAVQSEKAKGEALATAEAERDAAVKARDETQRVVGFLVSVLAGTSPMQKPESASIADVIDEAAARIDGELPRGESARMPLRMALVEVLLYRGDTARAEVHARALHADAVAIKGARSVEAAQALAGVGAVLQHQGQLVESEAALESAVALLDQHDDPEAWRRAAVARMRLASTKGDLGRIDEAIALFEASIPVFDERLPQHPNRISGRWQLARMLSAAGRAAEARETAEAALHLAQSAGSDARPADEMFSRYHLAMYRLEEQRSLPAAADLRRSTDSLVRWLGSDGTEGLACRLESIEMLERAGFAEEHELKFARDAADRFARDSVSSQQSLFAHALLARMLNARNRHEEAAASVERVGLDWNLATRRTSLLQLEIAIEAGIALQALGRLEEACAALKGVPERLAEILPADNPVRIRAMEIRSRVGAGGHAAEPSK